MAEPAPLIGGVGLILLLYAAKAVVLCRVRGTAAAVGIFTGVVALCVPATWTLSTDWDNRHVERVAIFVGNPVATLTVPCVSFLIDLVRRTRGRHGGWAWRVPLEVLIGVPAWGYLWVCFEFLVLGWVWI